MFSNPARRAKTTCSCSALTHHTVTCGGRAGPQASRKTPCAERRALSRSARASVSWESIRTVVPKETLGTSAANGALGGCNPLELHAQSAATAAARAARPACARYLRKRCLTAWEGNQCISPAEHSGGQTNSGLLTILKNLLRGLPGNPVGEVGGRYGTAPTRIWRPTCSASRHIAFLLAPQP